MTKIEQKIPDGWSVKKLGECFSFLAGGDVDKSSFSEVRDELHPYPIFANALTKRGLYGYSSKYKIKDECITITGRGDIGKVFYRKGFFTPIVRLITAIPRKNINAKFMSFSCECIKFWNETTGVPQLTIPQVQRYKILLPPLAEQEKIAEILSCWDEGIEKLSALIEKKKIQKKALMQQLLTGKHRLKGFATPWHEVKLGDICDITTGKKDVNEGTPKGLYPFFTCAKNNTFSDTFSFDKEAILVAGNGEVGNCKYYIGKFEAYQRTYVLSDFKINGRLIFQYLSYFFKQYVENQKQQGAMPYIKLNTLSDFQLVIPNNILEQNNIFDILSKSDEEIELLNKKLAAFKLEKKALMQQLLTGKIRVKVK